MSRRRIYVEERSSKLSFDIALLTGCALFAGVLLLVIGLFPFCWEFIRTLILIALFGFSAAWIAKKIEKIEENW
jgi:uncharacterized membrane protein HdeD (DUF308 family)